ncbi:MAG: PIN domain-containing protein [Dehalococcoidia bacterium]|nr:PIN domain-containing protein [Dehalococcoidia bacterium]
MPAENFFDSNIFVYLFERTDFDKYLRARALVSENLANRSGCISYQVVQETLNVIARRAGAGSERVARFLQETLIPFWQINQINPTPELYRSGLNIQARYGFSFYDSLIVAAALEAGCSTLYSEDMQDGQQIEGLTIRNPFAETRAT